MKGKYTVQKEHNNIFIVSKIIRSEMNWAMQQVRIKNKTTKIMYNPNVRKRTITKLNIYIMQQTTVVVMNSTKLTKSDITIKNPALRYVNTHNNYVDKIADRQHKEIINRNMKTLKKKQHSSQAKYAMYDFIRDILVKLGENPANTKTDVCNLHHMNWYANQDHYEVFKVIPSCIFEITQQ